MSLYFCGRLFSSESFSLFTCRTRTHRISVCSFLFARLSSSDSTHKTSVCSFWVGMEFFVRYDIVFLPTFPPVRHFLRFDLTFRTHRHTPSPVVASAPPPVLFLGFLRCVCQSQLSHFPACAMDSRVFSFWDPSQPTSRFAFPA